MDVFHVSLSFSRTQSFTHSLSPFLDFLSHHPSLSRTHFSVYLSSRQTCAHNPPFYVLCSISPCVAPPMIHNLMLQFKGKLRVMLGIFCCRSVDRPILHIWRGGILHSLSSFTKYYPIATRISVLRQRSGVRKINSSCMIRNRAGSVLHFFCNCAMLMSSDRCDGGFELPTWEYLIHNGITTCSQTCSRGGCFGCGIFFCN